MPITHTSRTGRIYRLLTGPKRGGGAQYYFSTKSKGTLANEVPEGFEIYESVGGQVFLRRKQPELIRAAEKAIVEREIEKLKSKNLHKLEVRGNTLTIHESGIGRSADFPWVRIRSDPAAKRAFQERFATYQAVMRFVLIDEKRRLFAPERFCFRGSVDDWISIGAPEPIEKLAAKYLRHLGKDSLYDLY